MELIKEESATVSELQRLVGIVIAPKRTFDEINRRPTWVLPFALVLIFSLAVNFVVYKILITDINFDEIARLKIQWDASSAGKSLSEAAITEKIYALRRESKLWYVFPFISVPISILSLSVLFWIALLLVRAKTTFGRVLAVLTWSFVIYRCVGGVFTIPALLARGPTKFFPGAPESWSPTSLAHLFSRTAVSPNVYSAISKLDIFLVWWLMILAIGLSRISTRVSLVQAVILVSILEALYLTINAAGWFAGTL